MKTIITLALIILLQLFCIAQTRTITARIIDSGSQKPVYNANVIVPGTTSGTTTNFLGYFQIELAKGYNELIISHVGYQTSQIEIPEVNSFSVNINPAKQFLNYLNLNKYPKAIEDPKKELNSENTNDINIVEQNAEYLKGWDKFYTELGNLIVMDSSFLKKYFNSYLEFVITSKGTIDGIVLSPDTMPNKEVVIKSISKLNEWKPAIQNNTPVDQIFSMEINYYDPEVFKSVEESSIPPQEFYEFMSDNLEYPSQARRMGVEGKVYVQFVVQKDGTLTHVKVIKGIGAGCDEEVVRVVGASPKWHPGIQKNNRVKQQIIFPIIFSLDQPKYFKDDFIATSSIKIPELVVIAIGIERGTRTLESNIPKTTSPVILKATSPVFPGGNKELVKFLNKNQKEISEELPPNKHGDKVQVEFTVDKNGKIGNILIKKSLGESFDKEAIRLYSIMPHWIPAKINGEAVEKIVFATVYFGVVKKNKINSANISFKRGVELFSKGKLEKSLSYFSKAIEDHPSQLDYYFNRAAVNLELGNIDKACEDLEHIRPYDQEALDIFNEYCNR